MKSRLTTLLIRTMALAAIPFELTAESQETMNSTQYTQEHAAVRAVIQAVGNLADRHQFEDLQQLYADQVLLDYQSLSGEAPQRIEAQTLMTQWASVLPGFDQTYHDLGTIQIELDGQSAIATAPVRAQHHLDGELWQVSGHYRYALAQQQGRWRITEHQFVLEQEQGDRALLSEAVTRAAQQPVAYLQRQQTVAAVRDFLSALERKAMDDFAEVWNEDAVQHMPYAPEGFPKRVEGKEALIAHYAGWPDNAGKADFLSQFRVYPMVDPQWVFVEFVGEAEIRPTGRTYHQNYGGLFHVVGGKISLFREYFDPAPFKYAFGLEEGGSFHPE
ncbi:nuclear transport factor 2 family protein [Ferrimonas marina]|uniref:Ketosteroid isomerase-related protein n=1 Tax=Ferrimonas marina TaxID=299255 RepID=A0A1M5R4C3_9GAMM|nr:nuclear transport factor 2 family protein [Ferrimonas marina]SHH21051.1 Ketosteroid isomerase-related protein [Ferrimonas marina]